MLVLSRFVLFRSLVCLGAFLAVRAAAAEKVSVVATHAITGEFVKRVGGEAVELRVLAGPGGDPHHFEPSPSHLAQVAEARVIFEIGLNYEPWLPNLLKASKSKAKVVPLTRGLKLLQPGETWPLEAVIPPCCASGLIKAENEAGKPVSPPAAARAAVSPAAAPERPVVPQSVPVVHSHGKEDAATCAGCVTATHDPHVWLDVRHAMSMTLAIADVLSDLEPARADFFFANATAYVAELRKLDEWAADEIMAIPVNSRYLVTEHYSFGYFARRYGLAIEGTVYPASSTEGAGPGPRQLVELAGRIKARKIPVIFSDSVPASPLVARVAKEAGVKVAALQAENLSAAHPSYEALIRYNVKTVVDGLSGD